MFQDKYQSATCPAAPQPGWIIFSFYSSPSFFASLSQPFVLPSGVWEWNALFSVDSLFAPFKSKSSLCVTQSWEQWWAGDSEDVVSEATNDSWLNIDWLQPTLPFCFCFCINFTNNNDFPPNKQAGKKTLSLIVCYKNKLEQFTPGLSGILRRPSFNMNSPHRVRFQVCARDLRSSCLWLGNLAQFWVDIIVTSKPTNHHGLFSENWVHCMKADQKFGCTVTRASYFKFSSFTFQMANYFLCRTSI